MTSTEKFIKEVQMNVKANHPVTVVYSEDPNDTIALIKSAMPIIRDKTDKVFYWTSTKRWTDITSKDRSLADLIANPVKVTLSGDAATTPLAMCFQSPEMLKCKNPVFIISLLSSQMKNENIGMLQELRDFDYLARNGVNDTYRIVIIANKSFEIPMDYENIFGVVRHEDPTLDELGNVYDTSFMVEYVEQVLCAVYTGKPEKLVKEFKDLRTFSVNTLNGLSARQFRLILYKAVAQAVEKDKAGMVVSVDFEKFKEFIYQKKFEELSRTGILTLLKPTPMTQVGGFDFLKEWLKERQWAFGPEAAKLKVDVPKGMALIGPPGTGKTWIAKATADALQFPCLQFSASSVFNKFVGDSEKNMDAALRVIESMAPCVLFVDEIDKVFAGSAGPSTDGGTTARVLGKLLTWMQDNDKDIFLIVTANRIQNVPSEFLRKGRLDEIWCVLFPTKVERQEIFDIHLKRRGYDVKDLTALIDATDDYSSSELEYIIKESIIQAGFKKQPLGANHLLTQAKMVVPSSQSFREDISLMRDWATNHARMASKPEVVSANVSKPEV